MFDFWQFIIDWKASVGSTLCDEMLTAPTFQRVKKEVDFVDLRSNFKLSIILPTQNSKSIWIARRKEDDIQLVNMMLLWTAHCASDVSLHLWCVRNSDVQNAVRSGLQPSIIQVDTIELSVICTRLNLVITHFDSTFPDHSRSHQVIPKLFTWDTFSLSGLAQQFFFTVSSPNLGQIWIRKRVLVFES